MNVISDNALMGGFAAQVKPINAAFVEEVCKDFDIRQATGSIGEAPSLLEEGEPPPSNGNGSSPLAPQVASEASS